MRRKGTGDARAVARLGSAVGGDGAELGCGFEDARVEGGRERTGGITVAPGLCPGPIMRP